MLAALDEAQAAIRELQAAAVGRSSSSSAGRHHLWAEAKARLEAAERAIHAAEAAERADEAEAARLAAEMSPAPRRAGSVGLDGRAATVVDITGGPVGLDLLCDGQLVQLEHEDKARLAFMVAATAEQLRHERAAREALEATVRDLMTALEGESRQSAAQRREIAAMRTRLLAQMSTNLELQTLLQRLHADSAAVASNRERFEGVMVRCEEIAARFEKEGLPSASARGH
jgi:DNA repair exonuclease SbcCD ATPase subunit